MKKQMNVPVNPTYHEVINDYAKQWEANKCEKYKEYREKWSNNPHNFIIEDAPLNLDIEPTNACNLKCPMCPRTVIINDNEKNKKFNVGMMNMITYKKIIDEAVEIGVYSIKLNWLGEPLVHPQIVDMVKYAKDKGIVDVMFNTNAALLTEDLSRKLIEAGLDKIFFSFDSPFKEKYEQIRIGAEFEETLNNIKKLIQIRNEMGKSSPLTRVSMVLMDENKDEYDEFVKLFKDIVDAVAYVEYADMSGKEFVNEDFENDFSCSQLWQRMIISWNGDIMPCCGDREKDFVMGNVNNENIKDIWNNKKYQQIRELHKNGKWAKMVICRRCDTAVICKTDGSV